MSTYTYFMVIYLSIMCAGSTPIPIAQHPTQSGRFPVQYGGQHLLHRPPSLPYLFRLQRWWTSGPFPVARARSLPSLMMPLVSLDPVSHYGAV